MTLACVIFGFIVALSLSQFIPWVPITVIPVSLVVTGFFLTLGDVGANSVRAYREMGSAEDFAQKVHMFQHSFKYRESFGLSQGRIAKENHVTCSRVAIVSVVASLRLVLNGYALAFSVARFVKSQPSANSDFLIASCETLLLSCEIARMIGGLIFAEPSVSLQALRTISRISALSALAYVQVNVLLSYLGKTRRGSFSTSNTLLMPILDFTFRVLISVASICVAFLAFIEKIRLLGLHRLEEDWKITDLSLDQCLHVAMLINQVINHIDMDKMLVSQALKCMFGRENGVYDNDNGKLAKYYRYRAEGMLWQMPGASFLEKLIVGMSFSAEDVQKIAVDQLPVNDDDSWRIKSWSHSEASHELTSRVMRDGPRF